jgi:hypothetical protein
MHRQPGLNFGAILHRIEKDYLGVQLDVPQKIRDVRIIPVQKDRPGVNKQFNDEMKHLTSSKYLQGRGIDESVLQSRRFLGTVFQDSYNNVIFPHIDEQGVCGFEKRNLNFKGFSKGGIKSIWLSNRLVSDTKLVIVEGGIDALSYHSLYQEEFTRYMSIGGEPSPDAWKLTVKIIDKFSSQGGDVVCGVDRDSGGDGLYEKLISMTPTSIKRELPISDDWNLMLTEKMKS